MSYYATWTAFPSEPVDCGGPNRYEPPDDDDEENEDE